MNKLQLNEEPEGEEEREEKHSRHETEHKQRLRCAHAKQSSTYDLRQALGAGSEMQLNNSQMLYLLR